MPSVDTPLLVRQESDQTDAAAEDLERGLHSGAGNDFRHLIDSYPETVIKILEKKGMEKLGSFNVPDTSVLPLIRGTGMLTLGSQKKDIDFEPEWRRRMQDCQTSGRQTQKPKGWTGVVEVEAHVVTIRNAAGTDDAGLLNPLLKRWQDQACSQMVFGLPAVQSVINFKWDRWARKLLLLEFAFYLVWLLSFQVFMLLFQDENDSLSLRELVATKRGIITVAVEVSALLGMSPFLYIEACTVIEYGPRRWLSIWNLMDLATYFLQVAIALVHLLRLNIRSEYVSILVASQCLLLWLKIQYFARVFQPTKNAFVDTLRSVVADVKWFLLFLVLTMWGFAGAFYILFREDQQQFQEFSTIWHAWLTMFNFMVSGFEFGIFYDCHNPQAAILLVVLYMFVVAVIFLNLLVGIMTDSWSKVKENEGLRFLCSKAEVIDEIESTVPQWVKDRNPSWYPAYVHVLKVNPESADEVEMDAMWSRLGGEPGESIMDDKTELNVKLSKMSRQLEALQAALDASQSKAGGGSGPASSANGQQHKAESDDEQTQAERKERFGEDS
ncbi:hypothetical protein ABBQ38_007932 [Trebouxia sp. C0009 RCD-2024]